MLASAMVYQPVFGQLVLGLVDLMTVGVGLYQLYMAPPSGRRNSKRSRTRACSASALERLAVGRES